MIKINAILDAYLECALWACTDDEENSLDDTYELRDIAPSARADARSDIKGMIRYCIQTGVKLDNLQPESFGIDFWLTRNRHGAGFWDRGLGDQGEALSKAAKTFGTVDAYAGDDDLIYFS